MWNLVFLQNSAINGSSDIWSRTHKEVFSHIRDTTPDMYRTDSVSHITMRTIFIHGFYNQSSNTDPIVDPEEHESTFVAEDDMLPLA